MCHRSQYQTKDIEVATVGLSLTLFLTQKFKTMTPAERERIIKEAKEAELKIKFSSTGNSVQLGIGGPKVNSASDATKHIKKNY